MSLIFHQLFDPETSTYTYLLGDRESREAVLIDPVIANVDRDLTLLQELDLTLIYLLESHVHADHVTGAGELRRRTGAKVAVSRQAKVECADIHLEDGQELKFGNQTVRALATPGHTDGCMSFYISGMVFTGDALLIRGTGRTDFQQGSPEKLYESITKKLFALPDETIVYPGHDYKGQTSSTIGMEKRHNPRIGGNRSKTEFVEIMKHLNLSLPNRIAEAVPANMRCGDTKRLAT